MSKRKKSWNSDYYTQKAKQDNYKARSAYKLEELNNKFKFLKKGQHILDLGCAPGSWMQYALKLVGNSGSVTGIDLKACEINGATTFCGDINQFPIEKLRKSYDAVISDMAPDTSGNDFVDAQRSLELCQTAWNMAQKILKKNGAFVCKIFQGEDLEDFFRSIKPSFSKLTRFKPTSSRDCSREIFIVGIGYK